MADTAEPMELTPDSKKRIAEDEEADTVKRQRKEDSEGNTPDSESSPAKSSDRSTPSLNITPNLPSWVRQIPSMTLNEEQRGKLEKAKAFAREMQAVLFKSRQSSSPSTPPASLPSLLLSANPLLATGIDLRPLSVLSRIYVGSINFELNEAHIKAVFGQFGSIKSVSMSVDPATGKHKGFCFIEFETPEAAAMALDAMNGADLGGRQLKVGRPNNYTAATSASIPEAPKTRIYISNVNEHITEENMASIFEAFGQINICVLMPDLLTRKHKGYGYIEFGDEMSAKTAIVSLNNFELGGLQLHVGPAIVGGPLSEGMKALDKLPATQLAPAVSSTNIPAAAVAAVNAANAVVASAIGVGATTTVGKTGGANGNPNAAAVAQNAAARIAADLVARGQGSQVESVALEENMSISASQRYAIMQKLAASREEISPILLVRNAVPISEVDDTLQEEFAEECTNYGKVTKVLIQAVSDGDEETESAGLGTDSGRKEGDGDVRIFVQFADGESSERARKVLDGRWFGGRRISAVVYDFRRYQIGEYWD